MPPQGPLPATRAGLRHLSVASRPFPALARILRDKNEARGVLGLGHRTRSSTHSLPGSPPGRSVTLSAVWPSLQSPFPVPLPLPSGPFPPPAYGRRHGNGAARQRGHVTAARAREEGAAPSGAGAGLNAEWAWLEKRGRGSALLWGGC